MGALVGFTVGAEGDLPHVNIHSGCHLESRFQNGTGEAEEKG